MEERKQSSITLPRRGTSTPIATHQQSKSATSQQQHRPLFRTAPALPERSELFSEQRKRKIIIENETAPKREQRVGQSPLSSGAVGLRPSTSGTSRVVAARAGGSMPRAVSACGSRRLETTSPTPSPFAVVNNDIATRSPVLQRPHTAFLSTSGDSNNVTSSFYDRKANSRSKVASAPSYHQHRSAQIPAPMLTGNASPRRKEFPHLFMSGAFKRPPSAHLKRKEGEKNRNAAAAAFRKTEDTFGSSASDDQLEKVEVSAGKEIALSHYLQKSSKQRRGQSASILRTTAALPEDLAAVMTPSLGNDILESGQTRRARTTDQDETLEGKTAEESQRFDEAQRELLLRATSPILSFNGASPLARCAMKRVKSADPALSNARRRIPIAKILMQNVEDMDRAFKSGIKGLISETKDFYVDEPVEAPSEENDEEKKKAEKEKNEKSLMELSKQSLGGGAAEGDNSNGAPRRSEETTAVDEIKKEEEEAVALGASTRASALPPTAAAASASADNRKTTPSALEASTLNVSTAASPAQASSPGGASFAALSPGQLEYLSQLDTTEYTPQVNGSLAPEDALGNTWTTEDGNLSATQRSNMFSSTMGGSEQAAMTPGGGREGGGDVSTPAPASATPPPQVQPPHSAPPTTDPSAEKEKERSPATSLAERTATNPSMTDEQQQEQWKEMEKDLPTVTIERAVPHGAVHQAYIEAIADSTDTAKEEEHKENQETKAEGTSARETSEKERSKEEQRVESESTEADPNKPVEQQQDEGPYVSMSGIPNEADVTPRKPKKDNYERNLHPYRDESFEMERVLPLTSEYFHEIRSKALRHTTQDLKGILTSHRKGEGTVSPARQRRGSAVLRLSSESTLGVGTGRSSSRSPERSFEILEEVDGGRKHVGSTTHNTPLRSPAPEEETATDRKAEDDILEERTHDLLRNVPPSFDYPSFAPSWANAIRYYKESETVAQLTEEEELVKEREKEKEEYVKTRLEVCKKHRQLHMDGWSTIKSFWHSLLGSGGAEVGMGASMQAIEGGAMFMMGENENESVIPVGDTTMGLSPIKTAKMLDQLGATGEDGAGGPLDDEEHPRLNSPTHGGVIETVGGTMFGVSTTSVSDPNLAPLSENSKRASMRKKMRSVRLARREANFLAELTLFPTALNEDVPIASEENIDQVLHEVLRITEIPYSGHVKVDVVVSKECYVMVVYCDSELCGLKAFHSFLLAVNGPNFAAVKPGPQGLRRKPPSTPQGITPMIALAEIIPSLQRNKMLHEDPRVDSSVERISLEQLGPAKKFKFVTLSDGTVIEVPVYAGEGKLSEAELEVRAKEARIIKERKRQEEQAKREAEEAKLAASGAQRISGKSPGGTAIQGGGSRSPRELKLEGASTGKSKGKKSPRQSREKKKATGKKEAIAAAEVAASVEATVVKKTGADKLRGVIRSKIMAGLAFSRAGQRVEFDFGEWRERRSKISRHAIVVSIPEFQDENIAPVEHLARDAQQFIELFKNFGFTTDLMSPDSPPDFLRPTFKNVFRAIRTVMNGAESRETSIVMVVLTRGIYGTFPGFLSKLRGACPYDCVLDHANPKNLFTMEAFQQLTDRFGNQPLIMIDAYPIIASPYVPDDSIGLGWCTMTTRPGAGSELQGIYPKNAGGLLTYYMKKVLSGVAGFGTGNPSKESKLVPFYMTTYLSQALQRRGSTVNSNLTGQASGNSTFPYFRFADWFATPQSILRNPYTQHQVTLAPEHNSVLLYRKAESVQMVRCNVSMLVKVGKDVRPIPYTDNEDEWWNSFMRSIIRVFQIAKKNSMANKAKVQPNVICAVEDRKKLVVELHNPNECIENAIKKRQLSNECDAVLHHTARHFWGTADPRGGSSALSHTMSLSAARIDFATHSRQPFEYIFKILDTDDSVRLMRRPKGMYMPILFSLSCSERHARKLDRILRTQVIAQAIITDVVIDRTPAAAHRAAERIQASTRGLQQWRKFKQQKEIFGQEEKAREDKIERRYKDLYRLFVDMQDGQIDAFMKTEYSNRRDVLWEEINSRHEIIRQKIAFIQEVQTFFRGLVILEEKVERIKIHERIERLKIQREGLRNWKHTVQLFRINMAQSWERFYLELEHYRLLLHKRNRFRRKIMITCPVARPVPPTTQHESALFSTIMDIEFGGEGADVFSDDDKDDGRGPSPVPGEPTSTEKSGEKESVTAEEVLAQPMELRQPGMGRILLHRSPTDEGAEIINPLEVRSKALILDPKAAFSELPSIVYFSPDRPDEGEETEDDVFQSPRSPVAKGSGFPASPINRPLAPPVHVGFKNTGGLSPSASRQLESRSPVGGLGPRAAEAVAMARLFSPSAQAAHSSHLRGSAALRKQATKRMNANKDD